MPLLRASSIRGAVRVGQALRPSVTRSHLLQTIARRAYASGGGHGHAQAGGDLPWAIGAVAATVPACYYLLSNRPEDSGHHGHGEEHEDDHDTDDHDTEAKEATEDNGDEETKEGAAASEEDAGKEPDEAGDAKSDDSGDESKDESQDESKEQDTPATSDDEGGEEDDGKDDGPTNDGKNTKSRIPDAKGGFKKRLDSNQAMKQGQPVDDGREGGPEDQAAASKTAGGKNSQSGKQEGLSNTDTKYSIDMTNNTEKSRKGEGTPETSKSKGTVDVNRPQPENERAPKKTDG